MWNLRGNKLALDAVRGWHICRIHKLLRKLMAGRDR